MSYDAFAETFSNSRKNLHWPELEYIIADMKVQNYSSILDIGCGNGRFLEQAKHLNLKIHEYHGIDSSGEMIKEAQKLHKTHNFTVFPMEILENC
jgi:ubiquinone/menaquinone biosynthesis C-methylase UbiE